MKADDIITQKDTKVLPVELESDISVVEQRIIQLLERIEANTRKA